MKFTGFDNLKSAMSWIRLSSVGINPGWTITSSTATSTGWSLQIVMLGPSGKQSTLAAVSYSPNRTLLTFQEGDRPLTQCAAVNTYLLWMRAPPHPNCFPDAASHQNIPSTILDQRIKVLQVVLLTGIIFHKGSPRKIAKFSTIATKVFKGQDFTTLCWEKKLEFIDIDSRVRSNLERSHGRCWCGRHNWFWSFLRVLYWWNRKSKSRIYSRGRFLSRPLDTICITTFIR